MKQQCEELRYKEVGTLLASDAEARDYFGTSATVEGTRLVVGAACQDSLATDAGKVYVYNWDGSAYIEVGQLTASDAQAYDYFGKSVAVFGNRLVVGADGKATAGLNAGKVYVYDWNSVTYTYDEVTTVTASDTRTYEYFGMSIALSGDRLVVGATGEDISGLNAGKVYVYDWNSTTSVYDEVLQLTASDAQDHDWFGVSVALSGDGNRLVVGAHGVDTAGVNAGKVYAYDWNGTTSVYDEVAQLTASDAQDHKWHGSSVALSGDGSRLVVGACGADTPGVEAGKVYVYGWNSDTSVYDEVAQLTASDAQASAWFGRSATVDGDRLVVGACGDDTTEPAAGKVYIYDWSGVE